MVISLLPPPHSPRWVEWMDGWMDVRCTSESWILRPETGVLLRRHASALRFTTGSGGSGCGRSSCSRRSSSGGRTRSSVLMVVMMVVTSARVATGGVRRRGRSRVGPPLARQTPLVILLASRFQPQRVRRRSLARKFERRRLSTRKEIVQTKNY